MNPVEQLARHVADTEHADLPDGAARAVKIFLLDSLGVAVAGSAEPWAQKLEGAAAQWGSGEDATLWVHGGRLPAPSAAIVNSYFMHCLEFDCVHEDAVVHPMATIVPAVFAQAERQSQGRSKGRSQGRSQEQSRSGGAVTGRRLLLAIALGVDVSAAIGSAARAPMRFFRPATAGAFGATAAVCKVAGLDEQTTLNALGAVYGQISGTLQPHLEGSPLLAMQMGFNARAALTAADLASAGLAAPHDVLMGQYGYYNLFEQGDSQIAELMAESMAQSLADLGRVWQVTQISHKPFPCGRLTHGAVGGLLQMQATHGFAAGEVERVVLRVPPLVYQLVGRPDMADPSPNYARLCLSFVAATALLYGGVDVPHFAPEKLAEPRVHDLAAKVEVARDDNPDLKAMAPQHVEVTLKNGQVWETRVEHLPGHPSAPLSHAGQLEKFRRNWGYGARPLKAEAGEQLIARIEALEAVDDIGELTALLVA